MDKIKLVYVVPGQMVTEIESLVYFFRPACESGFIFIGLLMNLAFSELLRTVL